MNAPKKNRTAATPAAAARRYTLNAGEARFRNLCKVRSSYIILWIVSIGNASGIENKDKDWYHKEQPWAVSPMKIIFQRGVK